MDCTWCIPILLVATAVLADYNIDNANTNVVYSMQASASGQAWQTYSMDTQPQTFSIANSTGNYTITVDPSHCYDQNYAYGECTTTDNCFVEVPFTGSGVAMYVFNAGSTGMRASFSVDGGTAVSKTMKPPPSPDYQVSQAKMYHIEGLQTGNHTIRMTVMDWNGMETAMKFDYAHVNETFVALSTPSETVTTTSTSSQSPSSTASANNSTSHGDIIGATLGGVALLVSLVLIGFFYLRKRKAAAAWRQDVSLRDSNIQVTPFTTELDSLVLSPQARQKSFPEPREEIFPSTYPTALHNNVSASQYSSHRPGHSSSLMSLQPLRRPVSQDDGNGIRADVTRSHVVTPGSSFLDSQNASRLNLSVEQTEVINRLQRNSVPMDTIMCVMEGFLSSNADARANDERLNRHESLLPMAPPPSYKEREEI